MLSTAQINKEIYCLSGLHFPQDKIKVCLSSPNFGSVPTPMVSASVPASRLATCLALATMFSGISMKSMAG